MSGLRPGDPDGHARWAQLEVSDDGQLVLCHDCGAWKKALGTHAWYAHQLTAAQYRQRHGLSTGQSLASPVSRRRFAAMPQAQPGSAGRRALEAHRDPDKARLALTREGQYRPQRDAARRQVGLTARRGRSLTSAEIQALTVAQGVDEWSQLAQRLVDDGVRQAEIARAADMPVATVSRRLTRRR